MKKGFTLTELVAVIVLMALIAVAIFPRILSSFLSKEEQISDYKKELIYKAVDNYMSNKLNEYPQGNDSIGQTYCISLNDLDKENIIGVEIDDVMEKYNYVRVRIGMNHNNTHTLVNAETEQICIGSVT